MARSLCSNHIMTIKEITVTKRPLIVFWILVSAIILIAGCSHNSTSENSGAPAPSGGRASNVSLNKNDYPVFPSADAGADPAVPADQGGKGFTGEGWQTNKDFDLIGDPRAVKGGM